MATTTPAPAVTTPNVSKWAADAQEAIALISSGYSALVPILEAITGKTLPSGTASSSSTSTAKTSSSTDVGVSLGLSATTDVGAAFTAAGKIADAISAHEKIVNSPAMQDASEAQKWQAFVDLINKTEQTGDEATAEKLEAQ